MAIENGPFIGDFPIETSIHRGFSIAMFDCQRVTPHFLGFSHYKPPILIHFVVPPLAWNRQAICKEAFKDSELQVSAFQRSFFVHPVEPLHESQGVY